VEIDEKQLRELLLWLWTMVENSQRELNAHQVVVSVMRMSGLGEEIDQLFRQARAHPSPVLNGRLQAARDTIEKFLREEQSDRRLLEFLKAWEPPGGGAAQ